MIYIKEAKQEDIDFVLANPVDGAKNKYPKYKIIGWAKTGYIDDEIVAVGGVVKYWEGVGEAWIYMSRVANDHPIEILRVVRKMIDLAFEELKLWRIGATARDDFPNAMKMLVHLGFSCEGHHQKYNEDGSDSWCYAKIKEE